MLIRGDEAIAAGSHGHGSGRIPDARATKSGPFALQPGDMLVAYTDGIAEPENEYGEEFGAERLTDLLLRYRSECFA